MTDVSSELIDEVLKNVQDQLVAMQDGQRAIRGELIPEGLKPDATDAATLNLRASTFRGRDGGALGEGSCRKVTP